MVYVEDCVVDLVENLQSSFTRSKSTLLNFKSKATVVVMNGFF